MPTQTLAALFRRFSLLVVMTLGASLVAAWLVGMSPGSQVDAITMDTRLNDSSVRTLLTERDPQAWLGRLLSGDLGESSAYGRPVTELLSERVYGTAALVATGLAGAWGVALAVLLASLAIRSAKFDTALAALTGTALSQPAAMLALLCLYLDWPGAIAIATLLFPQIYAYLRNVVDRILDEPHVLAAFSRGVRRRSVLWRHVLLRAVPTTLSLLGVSASLAIGAAVPVEVICDLPGLGQLIWEAALSRDLPLIVALTAVVAFVTISANFLADAASAFVETGAK